MQRARNEHEKKVQQITSYSDAEVQQLRAECEKRIEEIKAVVISTQQLEDDVERLEAIAEKLETI